MASVSVLPPVVIGIDLGTSSAKAVAFDQRGTAGASRSTEVALHTDGDRAEQDQHALLEAVVEATALALDVPRSIPMTTGGTADTEAIVEFVRLARLLALLEAAPDEPEHRRPQAHEQGTSLGVAALVLVDGLGADPQRAADEDRSQRADVGMLAAESQRADRLDHHWILLCRLVPASSARMLGAVVGTGESGRLAGLPPGTGCSGREGRMGTKPGRRQRAGTVLRWPLGMALTSWRYLWRTTPLHRIEE